MNTPFRPPLSQAALFEQLDTTVKVIVGFAALSAGGMLPQRGPPRKGLAVSDRERKKREPEGSPKSLMRQVEDQQMGIG
jgi:hypothetical protein